MASNKDKEKKVKTSNKPKNSTKKPKTSKASTTKKTNKKGAKGKITAVIIVFVIVLLILAVVAFFYGKNARFYKDHYYQGVFINGIDCSDMTVEEAGEKIQRELDSISFSFTDHEDRTATIDAVSLGITYDDNGELDQIMNEQNALYWVLYQNGKEKYNVTSGYTYSTPALNAWIDTLDCVNDGKSPVDAKIKQKEDGYYEVVSEDKGDEIDVEKLRTYIVKCVDDAVTEMKITRDEDYFFEPIVFSDDKDLNKEVEEKNKEIDFKKKVEEMTTSDLVFNSYIDSVVLSSDDLKLMIKPDKDGNPVYDKDKITTWVKNWGHERNFDTNEYLFVTKDGNVILVNQGDDMGWHIDLDLTAQKTIELIESGYSGVVTPVAVDVNGGRQDTQTYVELEIPLQTLWYIKNNTVVVESPVVTGDHQKGYDTPSNGVWHIYGKYTNYTMRGALLPNGTYEYVQFVNFAMPFNGQIFLHDHPDRIIFGGQIYLDGGSHGCVNMPYDPVKEIFEDVSIGTKVIVHD